MLVVATIAWGLRKCSRAIMLALIFLIAMKPGFVHAVYGMFVPLLFSSFFFLSIMIHKYGCFLMDVYFSDILPYLSVEPQHQQKDTQVTDSSMRSSFCTSLHS